MLYLDSNADYADVNIFVTIPNRSTTVDVLIG